MNVNGKFLKIIYQVNTGIVPVALGIVLLTIWYAHNVILHIRDFEVLLEIIYSDHCQLQLCIKFQMKKYVHYK